MTHSDLKVIRHAYKCVNVIASDQMSACLYILLFILSNLFLSNVLIVMCTFAMVLFDKIFFSLHAMTFILLSVL